MSSKKLTKNELKEINGTSASEKLSKKDFPVIDETPKPKKKRRGRKKKTEYYVDPELFKEQILQFYEDDILTEELGKTVSDIANRLGFMTNFINYTYREEMIGDAIEKMLKALWNKKYDPTKGSPFSYYTKIAFNAFCNRIKKEKRSREAILGYQAEVYNTLIHTGIIPDDNIEDTNTGEDNDA